MIASGSVAAPAARKLSLLVRDEPLALISMVALIILAWLYLWHMAMMTPDTGMADAMVEAHPSGTPGTFLLLVVMWAVMMLGMMLPSAIPMLLVFAAVQRRHARRPQLGTTAFAAGYGLIWALFSLGAAALQTLLANAMFLSPAMALTVPWVGGAVFVAAGLYQLSPLKGRCLRWCQGPVAFIAAHWRSGLRGALRMGLVHGVYCLGCCWALMLILFVGGVMNLLWVAAIAVFVLAEKLLGSRAPTLRWTAGAALILVGLGMLILSDPTPTHAAGGPRWLLWIG
jgi:predicted metal-binding membrane protein